MVFQLIMIGFILAIVTEIINQTLSKSTGITQPLLPMILLSNKKFLLLLMSGMEASTPDLIE